MYVEEPRIVSLDQPRFATDPRAWVWYRDDGRVDAYCLREGDHLWFRLERLASYRFPVSPVDGALRCEAVPDEGADLETLVDQFYRSVAPYALEAYGFESVHGCALRTPAGALVITAPSRAGKTTLALTLAARGYPLVADDAVILDPSPAQGRGRPSLRPLPFVPRARPETAVRFGLPVRERLRPPGRVRLGDPVPLAAFVLLDRRSPGAGDGGTHAGAEGGVGERPTLARLRPAEAFRELLGRAHFNAPDELSGDRGSLSAFLHMTALVPVFRLSYPSGFDALEEAADAIEGLVAAAPSP